MSLFVINRYEGESKKEVENETNHFSELLKKIEERKRQRAAASNKSTLDEDGNNLVEHKKKKKKKLLKAEEADDSHIKDENVSSEKIDEQIIKKLDEDGNNLEEPKKKKKKKFLKAEKADDSHIKDENTSSEKIGEQIIETIDEDGNNLEEPKKKKKLLKAEEADDSHIKDENASSEKIDEQIIETAKISTKKKKKKKDIENEQNSATIDRNIDLEEKDKNLAQKNNDNKDTTEKEISSQNNFIVLGARARKKQREVKRVLPDWLAHPEVISADLNSGPTLEELESVLDAKLVEVLRTNSINKLFPVQSSIIKWLHKCKMDRKLGWWPRDTCVSAPTGSGKTLAYVLPIVQELQTRLVPKIRCLIVLPVQELAAQVYKVMVAYTSHTSLKVGLLSGAFPFEQEQSGIIKRTERGKYLSTVDIVIATPGRLVDHILKTPGFSLDSLRFLVIDEADRGTEWLRYLPEPHSRAPILTLGNMRSSKIIPAQKLLFSATLSQDPEKLSRLDLFQPRLFTTVVTDKDTDVNLDKIAGDFVGRYTSPGELTELAVECSSHYKPIVLYQLLTRHDIIPKTLVFTNSGQTAHRLALLMQLLLSERNVTVGELSAQLASKQRESVLGKFASAEIHVLISSDALARGLDIIDVQLVVSYDLPKHIKGYIHRAGRTGRAGKLGTAVSVLTASQVGIFKQMLSSAHKTVPNIEQMELHATAKAINYQDYLEKLKEILEKENNVSLERTKAIKRRRVANVTKQNVSVE